MTNGEIIQKVFICEVCEPIIEDDIIHVIFADKKDSAIGFYWSWWNAEYKEPTTKNDLGVENDLVSSIVEKISEQVTETHEEFIFETIRPYCENVMQMKISKRDLEQALLKYYGKNDLAVDCISRADALALYCDKCGLYNCISKCASYRAVEKMPSVTPQEPRWIPVSEMLPKIADVYRVTRYYPNNVMNPKYLVDACCFDGSNTWYNDNRINHERAYADNVIAWQENPEPYMPQESEK